MNWLIKLLFPFLQRWAMKKGAKVFRGKYPPKVHAMRSRRYMWEHYWKPQVMAAAARTENGWDDLGAEFVYNYNANWIEDGTFERLLRAMRRALKEGDRITMERVINALDELANLDTRNAGTGK